MRDHVAPGKWACCRPQRRVSAQPEGCASTFRSGPIAEVTRHRSGVVRRYIRAGGLFRRNLAAVVGL